MRAPYTRKVLHFKFDRAPAVAPLPQRAASSGFVLERQRHAGSVFNDLAVIDPHVELADFGDPQITQRVRSNFHSIFRRILPRVWAGTDDFRNAVNAGFGVLLGHDSPSSGLGGTLFRTSVISS